MVVVEVLESYQDLTPVVRKLRSLDARIDLVQEDVIQAEVGANQLAEIRRIPGVERVRKPAPVVAASNGTKPADQLVNQVDDIGEEKVHEEGITGEGVRIGIIDPQGFNPSAPSIEDNVVATKSYKDSIREGSSHGTDVATATWETAPGAELLLSNVETSTDVTSAVEWMRSKDVDVIVAPFSTPAAPDNGEYKTAEAFDEAVNDGVFVAVSSGNSRQAHWRGSWQDSDDDNVLDFKGSDETNGFSASAGTRIGIGLTWNAGSTTNQDYDLYLKDESGNVVEKSTRTQDGDDRPSEFIEHTIQSSVENYKLVVKAASTTEGHTLDLTVGNIRSIEHFTTEYSVTAPATGNKVTAVGEYNQGFGQIARTSSQGPTADGRRGINVLAPSGYDGHIGGTSGAAPRVAGTAALIMEADSSLSVSDIEQVIEDTAKDVGPTGVDLRAGYGVINAYRAVDSVANFGGADGSANFQVNAIGAPDDVESESSFSVSATVENTGSASGTQAVELFVDGKIDGSTKVSLAKGKNKQLSWSVSGLSPGDHTIKIATDNDSRSQTVTVEESEPTNEPPQADAGNDQTVTENDVVTLDASGSSDPDGDDLTYQWQQTGEATNPSVTLSDASSPTPTFTAPSVSSETTLTFEVTVDDGKATATDTVNVTIQAGNEPPQAEAGNDQSTTEGKTVTLDASGSSDPDGDSLSYQWSQTGGPDVQLSGASSATPSFTAPSVSSETTLTFEVTVDDGKTTATDSVQITVQAENEPPQADAGYDQTTTEGKTVTLDASGSSDPDGDYLSYQWTQTGGPDVQLSGASSTTASFTTPSVSSETTLTFEVTVDDGQTTTVDAIDVTVEPSGPENETVFEVTSLGPDDASIKAGATINSMANVKNAGSSTGSAKAKFGLDLNENGQLDADEVLATNTTRQLVSLESTNVTFTVDTSILNIEPDTYTEIVTVANSSDTARITINRNSTRTISDYRNENGEVTADGLSQAIVDYVDDTIGSDLLSKTITEYVG